MSFKDFILGRLERLDYRYAEEESKENPDQNKLEFLARSYERWESNLYSLNKHGDT